MVRSTSPKVSIGLPVYNGEKYLRRAIDSHLSQTYRDFELIICDNASTDSTQEICEHYAAIDERIRYSRSAVNNGAVWNFNRCFELSRGEYFKWSAHDDILEPTFVERCVERLDAEPDASLCHTLSKIVDDDLNCLETYNPSAMGTGAASASARFGGRLRARSCIEIFGLFRSPDRKNSQLFQTFVGSDRAVLAELAVEGRFLMVPEYLFLLGHHSNRSSRLGVRPLERFSSYAPVKKGTRSYPIWSLYGAYFDIIKRRIPRFSDRLLCYAHMVSALFVRFNLLRFVMEPIWARFPWVVDLANYIRKAASFIGHMFLKNKRPENTMVALSGEDPSSGPPSGVRKK